MDDNRSYIELVKQAQLGDKGSLGSLMERVRGQLYTYVYRMVLDDALAEDIVQESMLEMFKVLGKLEKADRFWPWLRTIAFKKICRHHTKQQRQKMVSISKTEDGHRRQAQQKDVQGGLATLVSEELKQIVFAAMGKLKPQYRQILTMRCYEEMEYSEIAELIGRSELSARVLFCRAKKSLARQLSRRGLGRGAFLTALVLFGKMTAPSEAAAAAVSVSVWTTKVGPAASLSAIAASKTAVVSLMTAGLLTVGTIVATTGKDKVTVVSEQQKPARSLEAANQLRQAAQPAQECWYYYPEGADGPVMIRLMNRDAKCNESYCLLRQNDSGNYYFDKQKNTIYIENRRWWNQDLSVCRLPTDKPKLRGYLSRFEGRHYQMQYVHGRGDGLLVIARPDKKLNGNHMKISYQYNVLDEEYFRYNLPAGAKVVDNRGAMHRQGWTYFTVEGQLNGERVSGAGRIPFVYAKAAQYWPWLRLKFGRSEIMDDSFTGLSRPWMGLHTIDTVRRDAAEEGIRFESQLSADKAKAEVTLTYEGSKLVYAIDMERDIIEKITFSGKTKGELRFDYLTCIDNVGNEFATPRIGHRGTKRFSVFDLAQRDEEI